MADEMTGTVLRIAVDADTQKRRGFGFLRGADGREYFFHAADTAQFSALTDGDRVAFEPTDTAKGARARNVRAVA
jgi:cold shock CspA family protein